MLFCWLISRLVFSYYPDLSTHWFQKSALVLDFFGHYKGRADSRRNLRISRFLKKKNEEWGKGPETLCSRSHNSQLCVQTWNITHRISDEAYFIIPNYSFSLSALGISKYDSERLKTPQWRAVDHTFLWSVFTTSFLSFCLMSVYKEFWSPDTRTWILHRSWLNFRTSKCWNLSSQSVIPPPHSKCALTSVMSFFLLVDYLISHSTLKI